MSTGVLNRWFERAEPIAIPGGRRIKLRFITRRTRRRRPFVLFRRGWTNCQKATAAIDQYPTTGTWLWRGARAPAPCAIREPMVTKNC